MWLMKRLSSIVVALALGGCFATVGPDGQVVGGSAEFRLSLPTELSLVVVEPGVSVGRDLDHEVFFSGGYYWARQDQYWYRSQDHRRGWERVDARHVPGPVVKSPPGRYRHYRGNDDDRGKQEGHRGGPEEGSPRR